MTLLPSFPAAVRARLPPVEQLEHEQRQARHEHGAVQGEQRERLLQVHGAGHVLSGWEGWATWGASYFEVGKRHLLYRNGFN